MTIICERYAHGVKESGKSVEKIIATVLEGKKRDAHNIEFKGIFLWMGKIWF